MNISVETGIINRIEQSGWVTVDGITRPWEVHSGMVLIAWTDEDPDDLIDESEEVQAAIVAAILDEVLEDHDPR
jgi:hypothetical protein